MAEKHWSEASKKKTISLGGMDSIKYIEPVKATANTNTKEEKAAKKVAKEAELIRRNSQTSFNFGEEVMTPESIAEMNAFLNEKIKSLGTHSDEKEEAEDITLIKKMVKKPALKDGVSESIMESFIVDELSFVQTSPITSSLAESISLAMAAQ